MKWSSIVFPTGTRHSASAYTRCLGSHIARIELVTMVSRVLARMPDFQVDHDAAKRYPTIGIINGWINVPGDVHARRKAERRVAAGLLSATSQ